MRRRTIKNPGCSVYSSARRERCGRPAVSYVIPPEGCMYFYCEAHEKGRTTRLALAPSGRIVSDGGVKR